MSKPLTPDHIRAAIIANDGHYANAARSLGVTPDTMRAQMSRFRAQGYAFPKPSGQIANNESFYVPTPEDLDAERLAIRRRYGLPDAEYRHDG